MKNLIALLFSIAQRVKILSLGLNQLAKTVTKYAKKRTNSNIHTNKLLVMIYLVTSFYGKFTTLLRVIHNITNTIKTQPKYLNRVPLTMTSTRNKIDTEWANSLVGLHLKVPDSWWVSFKISNLNNGKIVSFDSVTEKWNLLLDDQDDDDVYLIAYDAVCEYANK
jgi:hypothetical protein